MITEEIDNVLAADLLPLKDRGCMDIYLSSCEMSENESDPDEMRSSSSCSSLPDSSQHDLFGSLSSSSDCFDADHGDIPLTDDDCFLPNFSNPLNSGFIPFEANDVMFDWETSTTAPFQKGMTSFLQKDFNDFSNPEKNTNELLKAILEETSSLFRNQGINFFQAGKNSKIDSSSDFDINMENATTLMQNNSMEIVTEITKNIKREDKDTDERAEKTESHTHQLKTKRKKRKYERRASARKNIQLYQFMLRLLDQKDDSVAWVSQEEGIFRLLKSKVVADMWGRYKKNENMTYESLSRALRHYYSQDILVPVPKKLHYKFCKKTLEEWKKQQKLPEISV